MSVSDQIVEILEYLGDKIGIAIDWGAENIWPQVQEFIGRYQTYSIVSSAIWLAVGLACLISVPFLIKHIRKLWDEDGDEFLIAISCVAVVCLLITGGVLTGIFAHKLLQWCFVPEMQIINIIQGYLYE